MVATKASNLEVMYSGVINNDTSVTASDIAKYLLSMSEPGTPFAITPLKLQKLLYYVQGWHMALENVNLFSDDFEAWDHGPVIRSIYEDYNHYGYRTIEKVNLKEIENQILNDNQIRLINAVWNVYGEFDGKYLEQLTHQEEPWINTPRNSIIDKRNIGSYFVGMLNKG